jgi:iron complex outermembrane recepter protein
MNLCTPTIRKGLLPAAIVFALAPVAASAQDQTQGTTELDRIQVTGSRIKQADIETSQPVLTMTRAEIEKQGWTSVADVLQRVSANGAALNRTFNNGGDGSAGVSLRNLGEARTLVLVNGRRWTSGLGGSVDLNTIPSAIIERIDVLKDGASTIYGSDAIAGVVNIITRTDFEGVEASAYYGQFGQGDGAREAWDATIGTSSDRGSLVIGASYVKEDSIMAGDRPISAGGPPHFGGQSGTGYPGSFVDPAISSKDRYVIVNGERVPYDGVTHGYNSAPDNFLLTPSERKSIFAQGTYSLTDNVSVRTEMLYNERVSEQLLAAMPVTGMVLDADSLYNPYDRDLISVNRRFGETGGRSFNQNVKTFHFYGGLEGFFEVGERTFDWDVGYRYDKTDNNELTYGLFNLANLEKAYGPSELRDGVPVCVSAPGGDIIAGCVPINPLGLLGSISQGALDYTSFTAHDSTMVESKGITVNLSGSIVELPAGTLGFAAGYERRKEYGQFDPDAFIAAGLSTGNGTLPTRGGYDLDEVYLELSIPVLADLPGAELLDFSVASRYSDYSNFGDTTNNKVGFRWKPFSDLLIRGNYAEGFRAPSINNLYAGDSDSYESYADPCSTHSPLNANPTVRERCAAAGVPADFEQPGDGALRQTDEPFTWQANADLQPEEAKNKTLGFVYSPSWAQGLNVSLDWWKIKIDNAITRPEANFILEKCYAGNATEQSIYCGLITRDPTYPGAPNMVTNIDMPLLNLSSYEVEGYDLSVKYRFPETSYGQFALSWDSTYLSNWERRATVDSESESLQGQYLQQDPYWRIRSNASLDWAMGDVGVTWTARYMSGLEEACAYSVGEGAEEYCSDPGRRIASGSAPRNHLASTTYHDLQVRWNAPWNATISLGANNLFAKDPPLALLAPYNQFDPQYDVPGRFTYIQYRQRF